MQEKYTLKILSSKDYAKIAERYPLSIQSRILRSKGFTDTTRNIAFVRNKRDNIELAGTAIHEILELVSDISPHEEMRLRFKDDEEPQAPVYQQPSWSANLPPEILDYIRQGVGKQITEPSEYGISSQYLQNLMGYKPEQFAYPMADIQKALEAQQALQLEQYQKQIRPNLAAQGQLDSTYYTNLLSDYLKGQQAQTYGTTADLLTNQAQQNLALSQWLPQFQSSLAQQLAGVGGQRAGVQQFNLQYPYQTYIPALQGMFGSGQQEAQNVLQPQMAQYQNQYQNYLQQQQQSAALQQALFGTLGQLGMSAATGGLGGLAGAYGSGTGFMSGALQGLSGISPSTAYLGNILGQTGPSAGVSSRLMPYQYKSYTDLFGGQTLGQMGGTNLWG